jgi:FixJ family two-component response regulator
MVETTGKIPLISIVDDDASVRVAVVNLVTSLGYEARSFDSADRYLSSPERHETSCIVCDVQMPGTHGLDLQCNLTAQGDRTPIIFITAFPRPDIKKRALDAGAICFLTKPFNGQMLVNCIEVALGGNASSGPPLT